MLTNIGLGAALFILTTAIHTEGMLLTRQRFKGQALEAQPPLHRSRFYLVALVVIWMFMVSMLEVVVWAVTYLLIGAIEGVEPALYFSTVTFTTLGYGDVTLGERWRLLGAFQAANGIIMFGWTTAIVIAAVQRVYFPKRGDS